MSKMFIAILVRLREYLRGVIKGRRIKIYVATYKPKSIKMGTKNNVVLGITVYIFRIRYIVKLKVLSLKKAMEKSDEKFFSLFLFW